MKKAEQREIKQFHVYRLNNDVFDKYSGFQIPKGADVNVLEITNGMALIHPIGRYMDSVRVKISMLL